MTQEEHILRSMPVVPDELNREVVTDGEAEGADGDSSVDEE